MVHVRRFIGAYRGKRYPWAYKPEEIDLIVRYSDDGTIRYMLNQQVSHGKDTYSGFHFFVVDNAGNVGYDVDAFRPYSPLRSILGNIHTGDFCPRLMPTPFPGTWEGTVDGVANLIHAGYKELERNNVLSFARQGGVYRDANGKVVYGNMNHDFGNPKIRAAYNFPPHDFGSFMASDAKMKAKCLEEWVRKLVRPAYHRLRGLR